MTRLLQKHKINRYSTFSSKKAAIVERFNRTLKKKIFQQFSLNGNYKWVKMIQKLVDEYNEAPKDVTIENEQHLLDTVYNCKKR